tara:strand:+ start:554 stop:835 length:282 start_codon:yes stop_codon:yes gene_type:complete
VVQRPEVGRYNPNEVFTQESIRSPVINKPHFNTNSALERKHNLNLKHSNVCNHVIKTLEKSHRENSVESSISPKVNKRTKNSKGSIMAMESST